MIKNILPWVAFVATVGSLPFWVGMWTMVGEQLIWGFDDFPVVAMIGGSVAGLLVALALIFRVVYTDVGNKRNVAGHISAIVFVVELVMWAICIYLTTHFIEA